MGSLLMLLSFRLFHQQQPDTIALCKDIFYVFEVHPEYRFQYISPSLDDHIGKGVAAASYMDPDQCFARIHPEDIEVLMSKISGDCDYDQPFRQRWRTNDGTYVWFEEYATPIRENGQIVAIQGVIRNIDEQLKSQQALLDQYRIDALTRLGNRHAFNEAVRDLDQEKATYGLILLDLNELKELNDRFGHAVGDALLEQTGLCIRSLTNHGYRIGGDEFVLIDDSASIDTFEAFVEHVRSTFATHEIGLAIGAVHATTGRRIDDVLHEADARMYQEKMKKRLGRQHGLMRLKQ
ncbi:sensor domain-containing diguanylate cyclase [Exiguobacterium sp. BRG2]|uniref:sensor domain-containing diguanylate cyclase n=1 Tax=Exiguobacterium sp. BRG2 TaxID=2962584 RepID=UPI0028821054|nr:sensor domain-containing diguanylate cyclase [Exiguobacterium sp. BRG2]MDT0172935.1 sensor domain-containing diguanylate cyclase [Exiguobacterium sp. BRG2]